MKKQKSKNSKNTYESKKEITNALIKSGILSIAISFLVYFVITGFGKEIADLLNAINNGATSALNFCLILIPIIFVILFMGLIGKLVINGKIEH